jgi:hypothetical protein
MYLQVIILDQL